jgi:hypothetical protein
MRHKAVLVLSTLLFVAAGTGSSVGAGSQPVRIVPFSGYAALEFDEAMDNLECVLGFTSLARYRTYGGFAARLSDRQLLRLERSGLVGRPLVESGSFLLRVDAPDLAAAERRIAELERRIGFTVDLRFGRGDFRGWGAALDWLQLQLLDYEPDVFSVTENPSGYIIWFDHVYGTAAVRRTAELAQEYGFEAGFVFEGLGGFYAVLSNEQLAALSQEPDLTTYTGEGGAGGGASLGASIHVNCLRASKQDRRALVRAFGRAHEHVTVRGPVGRILYVRLARSQRELGPVIVTRYALATFHTGAGGNTVELFQRDAGGRWRDRGRVVGKVCANRVPEEVLQTWLFRPVAPHCYAKD